MCYKLQNRIYVPLANSDAHLEGSARHQSAVEAQRNSPEQIVEWLGREWSTSTHRIFEVAGEWKTESHADRAMPAESDQDPLANKLFGSPEWAPVCALAELAAEVVAATL